MRYEGVLQCLHLDLAPEQKTDEIISINRDMTVKDSWSKAVYPNQNPVERGGIRILKQDVELQEQVHLQNNGHGHIHTSVILITTEHPNI